MYLDLLTNANLLDHAVWASPDTWGSSDTYTQAMEHAARRRRRGGGGLVFGAICCVAVIAAIGVGIYLMTKRKKNNDQGGQAPYGQPGGQPPYGAPGGGQPYGQAVNRAARPTASPTARRAANRPTARPAISRRTAHRAISRRPVRAARRPPASPDITHGAGSLRSRPRRMSGHRTGARWRVGRPARARRARPLPRAAQ
ncbi:hypothetical protein [Nocardia farcinica]|uniref:hypothetical protein n=1 Tax=Nocardia farcinica TaxID=37329 RepID=UPI001E3E41FB|nr:hypothetical protein [Nocardia farcinica]MCZ9326375.1 hypothetical protein [Nocardia farcinica]